jgi:hypothetical protein
MPPKSKPSEALKQKTLFNFINKPANTASSSPKTPFSKHRNPSNPVGSSPSVSWPGSSRQGDSSDVDVNMSSPAARMLKNSSSVQNSSPNTNTTVDLSAHDESDDEAPVRMVSVTLAQLEYALIDAFIKTTKTAAKRKAMVHDSDSESGNDQGTNQASFAQRIAKHAASKGIHSCCNIFLVLNHRLGKAPAKKRRTSVTSRDDDDFIVSDEEPNAPSKAASEDEEYSGVDEGSPKKKNKKVSTINLALGRTNS